MSIPFTQYLMPDGHTQAVTIDRDPEVEVLARKIIEAGYRFEAEVLSTGQVSFEVVEDYADCQSVTGEIVPNGPEVLPAVDRLVREAYRLLEL